MTPRLVPLVLSAGLAACASRRWDVVPVPPPPEPHADVATPSTLVPAGTELTIALVDELSTDRSVAEQPFRAVLVTDLTAVNGAVVVRAGTLLYGVVTRVVGAPDPLLAIDIPAVMTASGEPAPLFAKLKDAAGTRAADAVLTPNRRSGAMAYAGGEPYYDARAEEIRIPAGGRLRLELTRPLVPAPVRPRSELP